MLGLAVDDYNLAVDPVSLDSLLLTNQLLVRHPGAIEACIQLLGLWEKHLQRHHVSALLHTLVTIVSRYVFCCKNVYSHLSCL